MASIDDPFLHWLEALQERHLSTLKFSEVRKAVQALSSLYVERRDRIDAAAAFDGAGKRAAFAMYFGPLHFLLVREMSALFDARFAARILDLLWRRSAEACGTTLFVRESIETAGRFRNASGLQDAWHCRQGNGGGFQQTANRIEYAVTPLSVNELTPSLETGSAASSSPRRRTARRF
jgi:hypothetical protein